MRTCESPNCEKPAAESGRYRWRKCWAHLKRPEDLRPVRQYGLSHIENLCRVALLYADAVAANVDKERALDLLRKFGDAQKLSHAALMYACADADDEWRRAEAALRAAAGRSENVLNRKDAQSGHGRDDHRGD